MVTLLDTHQAVKELTAAQLSDEQAEAIVRLWQRAREADFSELVTKAGLRDEVFKLERRMGGLEHRLEAMENRLLVRLGGPMAASIGIIAVMVGIF
jgi:hypothetical protein